MHWLDLNISRFVTQSFTFENSQEIRNNCRAFFTSILLPLYEEPRKDKNFKFSVLEEDLTFRIFFNDMKNYYIKKYGNVDMETILRIIGKTNKDMTEEFIQSVLEARNGQK